MEEQAQDTQEEAQTDETQASETQDEPLTFDTWFAKQDDSIKGLVDSHTKGLKSALDSERQSRKDLSKRVAELSQQAETGSELRSQLEKITSDMDAMNTQASFYEEAHKLKVVDLKAAYVLAREGGMIDKRGNVDWDAFKTQYSYLIEKPTVARAQAGAGTGAQVPTPATDMNSLIRRYAGAN